MANRKTARIEREVARVVHRPRGGAGTRLASAARIANDRLYDLVHNRYFRSVPLDEVFGIVEGAGFRLDPEEKLCILTGRDGKATWQLYGAQPGQEVEHMLVLQWHKMDATGNYEIVTYVS